MPTQLQLPVGVQARGDVGQPVVHEREDVGDLDRLIEAAEDLADIQAARAARSEMTSEGAVPWDQVKADLGLV